MTLYNQIGEFGLGELLTKRLTTPGGSNSPAVAPEIFPVLELESDRPEWGFLKGEFRFARETNVATPGGGAHAAIAISNPSAARTIIVVQQMMASVRCRVRLGNAPDVTAVLTNGISMDSRLAAASQAFVIIGNSLTASLSTRQLSLAPDQLNETPIIVAPGTFLSIHTEIADLPLQAHVVWTERKAQPGELP